MGSIIGVCNTDWINIELPQSKIWNQHLPELFEIKLKRSEIKLTETDANVLKICLMEDRVR